MKTLLILALLLTTTLIGCKVADSSVTPTTPGACKILSSIDTSYNGTTRQITIQRTTGVYDANDNLLTQESRDLQGNVKSRTTYSGYVGTQYSSYSTTTYSGSTPSTRTVTYTRSGGNVVMIDTDEATTSSSKIERFVYDASNRLVVAISRPKQLTSSSTIDSNVYYNNQSGKPDSVIKYSIQNNRATFAQKAIIQYNGYNDPIKISYFQPGSFPLYNVDLVYSTYRAQANSSSYLFIDLYIFPPASNSQSPYQFTPSNVTFSSLFPCFNSPIPSRIAKFNFDIKGTNASGCISKFKVSNESYDCAGNATIQSFTAVDYSY